MILTPHFPDSEFIRDKVPMTKEEVRHVSVCKLRLQEDSVVYDIGSGTGSVSVEIACLSPRIKVYAIECDETAFSLTKSNAQKFGCGNITQVFGPAPGSMKNVPPATHAFIGGTKGNLEPILETLREKNPSMRVVVTAVTLESISAVTSAAKKFCVKNFEAVQMSVSRGKILGGYNLMQAENPVFVFSFDFNPEAE